MTHRSGVLRCFAMTWGVPRRPRLQGITVSFPDLKSRVRSNESVRLCIALSISLVILLSHSSVLWCDTVLS